MGQGLGSGPAGLDGAFWRGRRVFLTGHTGFIGGWTTAVLRKLGSHVFGFALPPPTTPSLFDLANLGHHVQSTIGDVRDRSALEAAFVAAQPDLVIHLAAQPLVGVGYASPVETFATNLLGTVNLLDCSRRGPRTVVIMTSDKVYRDTAAENAEQHRLGARDPYGASKVCCEIAAEAYAHSFLTPGGIALATVRAGNVIGGGDWASDRLIPDAVRAFSAGRSLCLRRPAAKRPWQHVLDAVYGLLLVSQQKATSLTPDAWNVGPPVGRELSVGQVAALAASTWGRDAKVVNGADPAYEETAILSLNSQRIRNELGFAEPWNLSEIVARTMSWYREALDGKDAWALVQNDIADYLAGRILAVPAP